MPVRVVLNVVYALMTKDMDSKQRRDFDAELYGLKAMEDRANKALWGNDDVESGGEG
jgi:hypothetical protein